MATVYTQAGEELVVDIIDGTTAVPTYWIGQGTSTAGSTKSDTALGAESTEDRVTASLSQPSADQNQFQGTINITSTQTVTEAGVFDSSAGGNMLISADFSGISVSSGDSIQYTFTLEQT